MIETGVVIDTLGNPIHWHEPDQRSSGSLPDSPRLWDVIWKAHLQAKAQWTAPGALLGFAHTHPGSGPCGPSFEDTSTFDAVEAALGRSVRWWIINADSFVICSRIDLAGETKHPELGWPTQQPLNTPLHIHYTAALQMRPISQRNGWMVFQMLGSSPSWVYELRMRSGIGPRGPRFKVWSVDGNWANLQLLLRTGSSEAWATGRHPFDVVFAGRTAHEVARFARQRMNYDGPVRVKNYDTDEEIIVEHEQSPYREFPDPTQHKFVK